MAEIVGFIDPDVPGEVQTVRPDNPLPVQVVDQGGLPGLAVYVFPIDPAATVWTLNHGLGTFPAVTTVDQGGNVIEGDVVYLDDQTVEVTFVTPASGRAYLS